MSNQEPSHVEKSDEASNVNDETEDCVVMKYGLPPLSLGNRSVVRLPFVMHFNSSVESGDITFVRNVPQGEQMRYS